MPLAPDVTGIDRDWARIRVPARVTVTGRDGGSRPGSGVSGAIQPRASMDGRRARAVAA